MREISIVDVSPRDGLQNESVIAPTEAKIELIGRLIDSGVRRIEAASFVHPRLVPAMADAEAVMAGVERRSDVSYIGLALNERGARRAIDAGVDEINFAIPTTDEFALANQNTTREQLLAALEEVGDLAQGSGVSLSVTVAVAFGCPFSGRVDAWQVAEVVESAMQRAHIDEIAIADTIGCGVPARVREIFGLEPLRSGPRLRAHFHETRHTSTANALAAVEAGVDVLDASAGGLGGCPFAPGASGNAATEDLVWALEESGYPTRIDAIAATAAGRFICDVIGVDPRSGMARAGSFPPHERPSIPQQHKA